MKKYLLLLTLLVSTLTFGQVNTSTVKAGKYQMNTPESGVSNDSVVVWDASTKMMKVISASKIQSTTNLQYTPSSIDGKVQSGSGTPATIPLSTQTNAGLISPAEKIKLSGIAENATANQGTVYDVSVQDGITIENPSTNPILGLGEITPTSVNGVSSETIQYLDATSSVQTQLNSKEDTSNKSSNYTTSSTTTYPNTKALVDGLATKVTGTGTTNRIPKFTSSNSLGDSGLIQVGGNIGMGSAVVPGELFHIGDGNILLEGGGEVAQKFKRDFITTGENLGVPTGSGVSVNPIFQIGRIIQAGDGDPEIRIMYSDDNTAEKTVFEVDRKGIVASVKTAIGSHYEGFASLTDVNPMFRLNSYPRMRLEMGAGGNNVTDVAVERGATGSLDFFTNSAYRGGFDSSGNLNLLNTPTAPTPTAGSVGTQIATKDYVLANSSSIPHLEYNDTDKTVWNNGKGNIAGNTSFGEYSLYKNSTGDYNVANGRSSLANNSSGSSNVANGYSSLGANSTGSYNVANGFSSLSANLTGSSNVANGRSSGSYAADGATQLTVVNNGVFVGADTRAFANNSTNEIVIGGGGIGAGSNTATIGNTSITSTVLRGAVSGGSFIKSGATATNLLLAGGTDIAQASLPISTSTQTALNLKANTASPTFTGAVSGITKSMVGLGNADNTADASKSVDNSLKWRGLSYKNESSMTSPIYFMSSSDGGTYGYTTIGETKSALGLGSNAYNSTAYLPLSGGALTGALNVSGSGYFGGNVSATNLSASNDSNVKLVLSGATDINKQFLIGYDTSFNFATLQSVFQGSAYTPIVMQRDGGNTLIGTATDNGSKLQVAGAATFSSSVTAASLKSTNLAGSGDSAVGTDSEGNLKRITSTDSRPYKVYTALISQSVTNNPTTITLESNLSGSIVWTYSSTGIYIGTLSGAFTSGKTVVFCTKQQTGGSGATFSASRTSNDTVQIRIEAAGVNVDGALNNASIEIRVYN